MKTSTWYNNKSQQSVLRDVPRIPAIVRSGPSGGGTRRTRTEETSEKKYFVVGKSKVGGKEVVGG